MKAFHLKYEGVLIAISNDKWLLELFIVQRGYDFKKCEIIRTKDKNYELSDFFLVYYFGYPITSQELKYVNGMRDEYESRIEEEIFRLEGLLDKLSGIISKKERKYIKKAIKTLRKIDSSTDLEFAHWILDDIIDQPAIVAEYFENLDLFKSMMEE